jgi:hypothetical protein
MAEQSINKNELYGLMNVRFNLEEVHLICWYLEIDYESFSVRGKSDVIRELISYCRRQARLAALLERCKKLRPNLDWTAATSPGQSDPASFPVGPAANQADIERTAQVHNYSGEWKIENAFSLWRGYKPAAGEMIYFHGRAFLLIPADGRNGFGMQTGELHVRIGSYVAKYEIVNRIISATVTEEGILKLDVKVLCRTRVREDGQPPAARLSEELFGSQEFELTLYPVLGEDRHLQGDHFYKVMNKPFQVASEDYQQVDW